MADRTIPDAMTLCNSCDAFEAVHDDPRGYCAKCGLESARLTAGRAREARDTAMERIAQAVHDLAVLPHEFRQRRQDAIQAQAVLDGARECVIEAAQVEGAFR